MRNASRHSRPILLAPLVAALAALSQAHQDQQEKAIKLTTDLVVVDAQVVNKKTGLAIGGLHDSDFIVYEDGVRQSITHFSQDKLPLSIILLVDVSGSVRPILNEIRQGAMTALGGLKPEDEVALLAFATRTQVVQGFTRDRSLVQKGIEGLADLKGIGRSTLIGEAVFNAALLAGKAASPPGRRVIVAVTDNIASKAVRGRPRGAALDQVLESGTVVCGLITSSWFSKMTAWQKLILGSGINEYVDNTGGIILKSGGAEVARRLAELIDQVRARYSIGYVSSNTQPDGKFRKIKVTLSPERGGRDGEIVVLSRRGYYAAGRR